MKKKFKTVSIIGFGRFGKLLFEILEHDFDIIVHDPGFAEGEKLSGGIFNSSLEKAASSDAVFFAVPISKFHEAIAKFRPFATKTRPKLLIDVLSVKLYPKKVFEDNFPEEQEILLAHPLFGPDSVRSNAGLSGLPVAVDKFRAEDDSYRFWTEYFEGKGLKIIEMSADEHDKLAAKSQGVAHFVGRILEDFKLEPTIIDTLGAKKLQEVESLASHDSWELFTDLQTRNPYTKDMRVNLGESVERIYNRLLPNRVNREKLVVGIQGGRGSFNEQAALSYLRKSGIGDFEIRYLHTTRNVLDALHRGDVDRGQFAIHNSIGGIVMESVEAMANHKFHIVEEFAITIAHALMIRPDAEFSQIDTIMTHPQVLAQCRRNLAEKYPDLKKTSGENDLIDHALVAQRLSEKKLPKNIATMGSSLLAELYGLAIIEDNLQDLKENFTSFLLVERPLVD